MIYNNHTGIIIAANVLLTAMDNSFSSYGLYTSSMKNLLNAVIYRLNHQEAGVSQMEPSDNNTRAIFDEMVYFFENFGSIMPDMQINTTKDLSTAIKQTLKPYCINTNDGLQIRFASYDKTIINSHPSSETLENASIMSIIDRIQSIMEIFLSKHYDIIVSEPYCYQNQTISNWFCKCVERLKAFKETYKQPVKNVNNAVLLSKFIRAGFNDGVLLTIFKCGIKYGQDIHYYAPEIIHYKTFSQGKNIKNTMKQFVIDDVTDEYYLAVSDIFGYAMKLGYGPGPRNDFITILNSFLEGMKYDAN